MAYKPMSLDHVNIFVRNAERSLAWYTDILGLHTQDISRHADGRMRGAFLACDPGHAHDDAARARLHRLQPYRVVVAGAVAGDDGVAGPQAQDAGEVSGLERVERHAPVDDALRRDREATHARTRAWSSPRSNAPRGAGSRIRAARP